MTTTAAEQPLTINPASDDEIDLHKVAGALVRRWPWIASGGALGLFLSGLHIFTTNSIRVSFRSCSTRRTTIRVHRR